MMSPLFRKSRVLETMRAGKKELCYKSNLSCIRVAKILGLNDFDALWICQEHIPTDHSTIENFIRAGKAHDLDVLVRVAKGAYCDYIRPLEIDAAGIMIPHLMSLAKAEESAHTVRFALVGSSARRRQCRRTRRFLHASMQGVSGALQCQSPSDRTAGTQSDPLSRNPEKY